MNKRKRGAWGEELAVAFLKKKGYTVIGRNYFTPVGEIDIIARCGACVVFAEVKVLGAYGRDELGRIVGPRKQRRIREVASLYLAEHREYADWSARCDVIAVMTGGNEIVHLENAF